MSFKFEIDVKALAADFKEIALYAEQELMIGIKALAASTHAFVADTAARELKSSLRTFQENLDVEEREPNVWVVSIQQPAFWIEDGIEKGHDMKPDLLKGAASKVIPFNQNKEPLQRTATDVDTFAQLTKGLNALNRNLKSQGKSAITLTRLEKNSSGSTRIGRLHELDIKSGRPAGGNHPTLKGLTIYQKQHDNGSITRDTLTFRTVSIKSPAESWRHPGYIGKHFLDRAVVYCETEWESKILPEIMNRLK